MKLHGGFEIQKFGIVAIFVHVFYLMVFLKITLGLCLVVYVLIFFLKLFNGETMSLGLLLANKYWGQHPKFTAV